MIQLQHRNLLIGIHDALNEAFFEENKYADKVLERLLKSNKQWGSTDRAVVSEIFYDIIRWRKRLQYYAGVSLKPKHTYELILAYLRWAKVKYKDLPELKGLPTGKIQERIRNPKLPTKSIEYSIPEWLEERMASELGDIWEREMEALNHQAPVILRTNTLKTSREELEERLAAEGVHAEPIRGYLDALRLVQKKNVFRTQAFKDGLFEIQDASSQLVAPFLKVEKGMRVIDACAGAGGKTLHLAAEMQNKGQLIAMDVFEWKLQTLKQRARRNGAFNIETRVIEGSKTIKRLQDSADRLLIDAPCTGLGVLKRNPDAKWKLSAEFLERVQKEQEAILDSYPKMVKKGGLVVYATCSVLPSENTQQVEKFLSKHPEFELEEEKKILPSEGYDGFYISRLRRIK